MSPEQLNAMEKIKKARKEKHLTYRLLAEKLNVSATALCRIEQGYRIPNPEFLSAICDTVALNEADKTDIMLAFGYMEV